MSENLLMLIIVLAVLIIAAYIWMDSKSKSINDYFCNAVRVYYFTGSQDAGIAAVAAAMVAAVKQRKSMLEYLRGLASDFKKELNESDSDPELCACLVQFGEALAILEKEISLKDWTRSDIREQKEVLGKANPDYLEALNKFDPTIFAKKSPDLFK